MKKITLSILAAALVTTGWAQKLDRSIKPKPGPAPEIKLGKTESFTLPNGLKVFVVENHKLPTLSVSIQLDIRPELEGDMAGYQDMMSDLLLAGTAKRSKDKLNAEIDDMGANVNVSAEGINASCLKKYEGKIFDIVSDISMNAIIPQSELDVQKKKALSGLETQKNNPDAMVRNVSAVVNFGKNHPYGEVASEETISKITVERCNAYYQKYYRPNVAYMAIVGDITMSEVKPLIEKYFGEWKKQDVPVAQYSIPEVTATKLTKVAFAPRIGAVQSVVSVTYPLDLQPNNPDVIKARVTNTILGGGSQGRLFLDLREKHAWTYGAYSSIKDDELGGSFSATVKCRNAVSDSAIQAILDEMRMMQTDRMNDTALQNSITYLSGNFAIGLEDPKRVAQFAINIDRYHMPADFYQNYLKNLSAVTSGDVLMMAQKYIRPDHANIVVAGSREEVAAKLAKFSADGKIDYYSNVGKPITVSDAKTAPADMTADKVFKKYVAAMGGEKAISGIKDMKTVSTGEIQGIPITITELKKAPNMLKREVAGIVQGKSMTFEKTVFNGSTGYQEQQGQKQDLKDDELAETREEADITGDLHPEKYHIVRELKGMENIEGNDAYLIEATDSRKKTTKEYYDAKSGLLVRRIETQEGPRGTVTAITDYKDYQEVPGTSGYKVPYTVSQQGAGPTITVKVQSVDINKGVTDAEFN